jgi:hypothetical protein
MQSAAREVVGLPFNSALSNLLTTALLEKCAANAAAQDFSALSTEEVSSIASNVDGLYPRERSWLAVEHLCALALARALHLANSGAKAASAH